MSEERQSVNMDEFAEKFANVYFIKLLFKEDIKIPHETLYTKLEEAFGEVDKVATGELSSYALCKHVVTYQGGEVPSQVMITNTIPFNQTTIPEMAMYQCWTCDDAKALLQSCSYEVMVGDFMAGGLEIEERCQMIAKYVDILLEVFPECIALYWPHSQKFMPVQAYVQSQWNNPKLHFLDGGLNVRFFNIQDSEDMLVDTTGLISLGIPDLQIHFHDLDHNFVIQYIYNFASYLFMNGDVVKDGETMDGRDENERWVCQHEDSLIAPRRVVLDINANQFAAGNRNQNDIINEQKCR